MIIMRKKFFCILLTFSILFCAFSGCAFPAEPSSPVSKTGFYFDTVITVTLSDGEKESLLEECFAIAEKYEALFSASVSDSEISKINNAHKTPVTVSGETIALLKKGLEYCELSDGRFDITIGNLSSLWDFKTENAALPDEDAVKRAAAAVDYRNVVISGNTVQLKNPDAAIDLGAIAKGYIADRMKAFLNENGAAEGTINLGGNVLCLGEKKDGSRYRIGIQKPFDEHGTAAAVVEVTDQTVVSSGIYERYITVDDKIYHHILNPATGYPYENNLLGVTIICPDSVDGDGLSTTCFSLGLDQGMELAESLSNVEAIFITDDYQFHCSSGIGDTIPFEEMK